MIPLPTSSIFINEDEEAEDDEDDEDVVVEEEEVVVEEVDELLAPYQKEMLFENQINC